MLTKTVSPTITIRSTLASTRERKGLRYVTHPEPLGELSVTDWENLRTFGFPVHLYAEKEETVVLENPAWCLPPERKETAEVLNRVVPNQVSEAAKGVNSLSSASEQYSA